jgi:hypothetical protein
VGAPRSSDAAENGVLARVMPRGIHVYLSPSMHQYSCGSPVLRASPRPRQLNSVLATDTLAIT